MQVFEDGVEQGVGGPRVLRRVDHARAMVPPHDHAIRHEHSPRRHAVTADGGVLVPEVERDAVALWRSVWESPIDAVFIGAAEGGAILAANPAACEMLDRSEEEICQLGRSAVLDLTEPGIVEAIEERDRVGRIHTPAMLIRRDGTRVPTHLSSVRAELDDGRTVYVTLCRDTSEFEDLQAHLDAVLSNTPDLVMTIDPSSMHLLWWNEAMRASVAASIGVQLRVGMRAQDIFPDPERAAWWSDAIARCVAGEVFTTSYRHDDSISELAFRPITFASGGSAVMVCARDITAEVSAATALAASEEKYRSVVASMAEGVVFQAVDGRIVETNEAALAIEGRTEDEMIGKTSESEEWGAIREDGTEFPGDEHPSMVTLRTGEPQTGVVMGLQQPDRGAEVDLDQLAARQLRGRRRGDRRRHDVPRHHRPEANRRAARGERGTSRAAGPEHARRDRCDRRDPGPVHVRSHGAGSGARKRHRP